MIEKGEFEKPGELLKALLRERGWSQQMLADIAGRPAQAICEIIAGTKEVTAEMAVALSQIFNEVRAEEWLRLQAKHALAHVDSSVGLRTQLFTQFPVSELQRLGWINRTKDAEGLQTELERFYGVTDLAAVHVQLANLRKSSRAEPKLTSVAAWLAQVKREAAIERRMPEYDEVRLKALIPQLAGASRSQHPRATTSALLKDAGVRFVELLHLQQTYLDGAALWLNAKSPVVAITGRYSRLDNFEFTVLHEVAHILLRHSAENKPCVDMNLDAGTEYGAEAAETEANQRASEWLIPTSKYREFLHNSGGRFTEASVTRFADDVGVDPAIVVGRLQFERFIGYNCLRSLLRPAT